MLTKHEQVFSFILAKCLPVTLVLLFALISVATVQAAGTITREANSQSTGQGQSAQIVWKLSGLGKPSGDPLLLPNGNIFLPLGSQVCAVDQSGLVRWTTRVQGAIGSPAARDTSIYLPAGSSVQELKLNGAAGWCFAVYPSENSAHQVAVAGSRLYLPHTSGLYALDSGGRLLSLSPWNTADLHQAKLPSSYTFMACASVGNTCLVVYGTSKSGMQLAAFDQDGSSLWSYWLGDLKSAAVIPGQGDRFFVVTNPKQLGKSSKGKVYAFETGSSRPLWQTSIYNNAMTKPLLSSTGSLYLTGAGKMYALNAETGAPTWDMPYLNLLSPVALDSKTGHLYAGCSVDKASSGGRLIAAAAADGKMIWSLKLDGTISRVPLVGNDGYLYVATDKGTLYKIRDLAK